MYLMLKGSQSWEDLSSADLSLSLRGQALGKARALADGATERSHGVPRFGDVLHGEHGGLVRTHEGHWACRANCS